MSRVLKFSSQKCDPIRHTTYHMQIYLERHRGELITSPSICRFRYFLTEDCAHTLVQHVPTICAHTPVATRAVMSMYASMYIDLIKLCKDGSLMSMPFSLKHVKKNVYLFLSWCVPP